MAGIIKTNQVQLGDSATATQNFVLRTNVDGTVTLARGNVGATTQDILTVDANGRIAMPQSVVAFSAYQSTLQSLPSGTVTKIQLQTKEFDTGNFFDATTNYRFTPLVAGYYQVSGGCQVAAAATTMLAYLYKNGVVAKTLQYIATSAPAVFGSALVYLNGTTDYIELYVQQNAATQNSVAGASSTYFQAILIAKA